MNEEQNKDLEAGDAQQHFPEDSHAPKSEISSIESQTSNMEVHKHPHHVTHKKKWTEYLLEFLMLFLAVFLGFLADNYREHIVEQKREKQYMRSMVQDLSSDITNIDSWLHETQQNLKRIDTSILLIAEGRIDAKIEETLDRLMKPSLGILQLEFNNRTSTELQNSGAMRLIRNKKVEDSILAYWEQIAEIDRLQQRFEHYRTDARDLSLKIFNYVTGYTRRFSLIDARMPYKKLIITKPEIFSEYGNHLANMGILLRIQYMKYAEEQKMKASELIKLIEKEYNLENE